MSSVDVAREAAELPPRAIPASTSQARGTEHLAFIDGIRALCALFVLIGHTWFEPTDGFYRQRWMNKLGLSYGHLAVVVFIVVSGFVITLPIFRRQDSMGSVSGFFKRRARRILPPYYAALAFTSLFILVTGNQKTGTVWDAAVPFTWAQLLSHVALVHNLPLNLPGGLIGYQYRSIAVEFQIYLITPLLMLGVRRLGFPVVLAVATSVAGLMAVKTPWLNETQYWFVVLFLCGSAAARLVVRHEAIAARLGLPGFALVLLAVAAVLKNGNVWYNAQIPFVEMVVGAGTAMIMASLVEAPGPFLALIKRFLLWRPLVTVGTFSYSVYLVHTPLLHTAWLFWSKVTHVGPLGQFGLLLLTTPLIVAAAWPFFLVFEKPFMRAPAPRAS